MMTYLNDVTAGILGVMAAEYVGVGVAVMADLVSGVRKARREGDSCSSRGLRRTVSKLTSYYLLLFCLSVVDGMALAAIVTLDTLGHPTIPPFPWLTSAGALSLALIEVVSIVENSPHRLPLLQSMKLLLRLLKR